MLYPSPIFGPVHSRRLGLSLGINLMPADGKMCSFDCIYCECGFNADARGGSPRPTRDEVAQGLQRQLELMSAEGRLPDVLTFAGNGEPTLHPQFADIIADTRRLRDAYCPEARISVLSNATQVTKPAVHQALMLVDNNIQKLDTVDIDIIRRLDRPAPGYDLQAIIDALARFNGHVIVQTMFLTGHVDNTDEQYVAPWLEALKRIAPQSVMVYTIDRPTPDHSLRKADAQTLDAIAERVRALGMACSVAY